jgi:hypothetical protein
MLCRADACGRVVACGRPHNPMIVAALTPVVRFLNSSPTARLIETLPCLEIDRDHETSHVRSG